VEKFRFLGNTPVEELELDEEMSFARVRLFPHARPVALLSKIYVAIVISLKESSALKVLMQTGGDPPTPAGLGKRTVSVAKAMKLYVVLFYIVLWHRTRRIHSSITHHSCL